MTLKYSQNGTYDVVFMGLYRLLVALAPNTQIITQVVDPKAGNEKKH